MSTFNWNFNTSFDQLPNQNLKEGGDGDVVISNGTWDITGTESAKTFRVINGSGVVIQQETDPTETSFMRINSNQVGGFQINESWKWLTRYDLSDNPGTFEYFFVIENDLLAPASGRAIGVSIGGSPLRYRVYKGGDTEDIQIPAARLNDNLFMLEHHRGVFTAWTGFSSNPVGVLPDSRTSLVRIVSFFESTPLSDTSLVDGSCFFRYGLDDSGAGADNGINIESMRIGIDS